MPKSLKVVELFAGVGGFRLGLEGWNGMSPLSGYTEPLSCEGVVYQTVWSNQWEPSTKRQHASEVYAKRWPSSCLRRLCARDGLLGFFPMLVITLMIFIILDSMDLVYTIRDAWISLYEVLTLTAVGGYFTLRSVVASAHFFLKN